MPIYEFAPARIFPLTKTTFGAMQLHERRDLQQRLRENIAVIAPDTLVIAEKYGEWDDSRRRIDPLGINRDAILVVIELKRTEDGGHMELQAIRYAAMVSTMTFDQAVSGFDRYLRRSSSRCRSHTIRRGTLAITVSTIAGIKAEKDFLGVSIHCGCSPGSQVVICARCHRDQGLFRAYHPARRATVVAHARIAVFSPSTFRAPLLTPPTTRSVKRASAVAGKETVKQAAHAGRVAWQSCIKLLGMFGNRSAWPAPEPTS